jgi:tripartite-type tricarboxylate transporter receptor subunit TctC
VPFTPDGSNSLVGRVLSQKFHEVWGQTVIIDHCPGSGSSIGIDVLHLPYKGGNPSITAVKMGVSSTRRADVAPDIFALAKSGVPGYEVIARYNVFAPSKTPAAITSKHNAEINGLLQTDEVKQRSQALGVSPLGGPPETLAKYLDYEITRCAKLIQSTGVMLK